MSFLTDIRYQVKEYAELISAFVDCEVEIVDENMLRIAATGKFEHLENRFSKGAIYKDVLLNGESHVVENPSRHPLCKDCEFKEKCQEKLEIAAPITHNDKIIGVIGIVALTDIIKYKVLRNVSLYLDFTEQISDLISETIDNHEKNDTSEKIGMLHELIINFDKYSVILDKDNTIIDINSKAERFLHSEKGNKMEILPTDETMFGKKVFSIKIGETSLSVAGILLNISKITEKECQVFFFYNYN